MSYQYLNMSKLSDTGLILLIIGTFLIVFSMILLFEITPNDPMVVHCFIWRNNYFILFKKQKTQLRNPPQIK
jgi:uncharacterized protein (DUF983 family)